MTLAALLPAVILIYYIYRRDTVKEPVSQLIRGFVYGVISAVIAGCLEQSLALMGLVEYEPYDILSSVNMAIVGAALPEEATKLFMLWLLLRHNRWFDEWMDGVVYAVSIGMGFAAMENIGYVFNYTEDWQHVALMRGITAVPAHFAFAVMMGFFYSLVHIGGRHARRDRMLVLAAPVMAHGAYDAILMAGDTVPDSFSLIFTLAFIALGVKIAKTCRSYIRTLRAFDTIPNP